MQAIFAVTVASVFINVFLLCFYICRCAFSLPSSLPPFLTFASLFLSHRSSRSVFGDIQSTKSNQTRRRAASSLPPSLPPSSYCSNADKVTFPTNRFLNDPNNKSPLFGCTCTSLTKGVRPEGSCNTRNNFPSRDKTPPRPYLGMKV